MDRSFTSLRTPLAALVVVILAVAIALPALAASPGPSAGSGPAAANPTKGPKGPKADRSPEVQVTVQGLLSATKRDDGSTEITIASGGKTLHLRVGPPWYVADKNPLAAFVGKNVTIVGEQEGDAIDVDTVDGVAVRAPGKPPGAGGPRWAGGWKHGAAGHPGAGLSKLERDTAKAAAKAAREAARAACQAAGTCIDDEPEASEAP